MQDSFAIRYQSHRDNGGVNEYDARGSSGGENGDGGGGCDGVDSLPIDEIPAPVIPSNWQGWLSGHFHPSPVQKIEEVHNLCIL